MSADRTWSVSERPPKTIWNRCICNPCMNGRHDECYRKSEHFGRCMCAKYTHDLEIAQLEQQSEQR